MVANIRGYTPNYKFRLINFDTPRWHTLEYANWNMADALLLQSGIPQVRGGWQNNTAYLEGDRVFDEDTSATYRCLIAHTSALTGTFGEDRILHPAYWSLQLSGTPVFRDEWVSGVAYVLGDIVSVNDYTFYLCTMAHMSSVTFPPDALFWQEVFDAAQVVIDSEAAKDAAYQFSLDAQDSANDAQSSANDAQSSEDDAAGWANDARAATGGFRWAYSSSTTAADPATGRIAFNSATPASVTEIYLSAYSSEVGNPDVSDWVATWDDSTNVLTRGTLQLRKIGAPEQFMIFELKNNITDNGAWLRLPVAYINHSGTLINGEALSVGFVRAGNQGPTGTGGGDMLRANNLNDVVSVPSSRTNLGLGTAQIPTFSQVLLGNDPSAPMHAATRQYVDSSPSLVVSDTAPNATTSLAGTLWWDSDLGTLFVLYDDGNSKQWVQATATPGIDTSNLATKAYADAGDAAVKAYAAPFDAMAYSGMQHNGSFEVSQENGTTPVSVVNALSKYVLDGWIGQVSGPGTLSFFKHATYTPLGYPASLVMNVTVANAAPAVGNYAVLTHAIEGYRMSRLLFGTASARSITLAFWVNASRTGLLSGALLNGAANRSCTFSYTVNAANVWEYKTVTIPGDVTGTWAKDHTAGIYLSFAMMAGSTVCTTPGVWTAGLFWGAPGTVNCCATTSDNFAISGLVVLPGTQAPTAAQSPLIMRPYDQELATCMRYYQKSFPYETPVGPNKGALGAIAYVIPVASAYGAAEAHYGTKMRASPAITCYNPAANVNNKWYNLGSAADSGTPTIAHNSADRCLLVNTHVAGDLANHSLVIHYVADARL